MIKKYFGTGLVILLPIMVTAWIVVFLLNMLTKPFLGIMQKIIGHLSIFQEGFFIFSGPRLMTIVSQVLIVFSLFFVIVILGFLGRWFFVNYLFRIGGIILQKIPFVNKVYKMSKEVIKTLFTDQANSFKKVVLVPFPSKHAYTIGFITGDAPKQCSKVLDAEYTSIYVPTTPNPTSGYLMLFKKEDILELDLPVEEGLKYLLSCGVIQPSELSPLPLNHPALKK